MRADSTALVMSVARARPVGWKEVGMSKEELLRISFEAGYWVDIKVIK